MSLYNYVGVPNSNLVCCICRMPFTDPTTTQTCAHTFCRDCILRAIDHVAQCPVDRSPLTVSALAPANPIVCSLVDELEVECVHKEEGCAHTCERQFLATHLQDDCVYREVGCPQGKCDVTMMYKDKGKHTHEGEEVGGSLSDTESSDETEKTMETSEIITASDPIPPPDPRFAALGEQNLLLRKRVETLESLVETFRREMAAVKGALGPWFRMGNSVRPSYHSYYSGEIPTEVQHSVASTSGIGERGSEMHMDPLGPYLRPVEAEERRRQHVPGMGSIGGQGYEGMYGFGPVGPPHTYTIAPLDLSTSLEGTLGSLRESVVDLAAGVDSMGRRQEIALTNEAMRLGEEMGGLRAGMHGLRMQVHAIMMDRNAQVTGRDEGWAPPGRMYYGYGQGGSITKL